MFRLSLHARQRMKDRRIDPAHVAAALETHCRISSQGRTVEYLHRPSGTVVVVNRMRGVVVTVFRVEMGGKDRAKKSG